MPYFPDAPYISTTTANAAIAYAAIPSANISTHGSVSARYGELLSYSTPIAAYDPDTRTIRTTPQSFSVTTTRAQNRLAAALTRAGYRIVSTDGEPLQGGRNNPYYTGNRAIVWSREESAS